MLSYILKIDWEWVDDAISSHHVKGVNVTDSLELKVA